MGKFHNKKITIDGRKFDSILEFQVYRMLKSVGLVILGFQPKIHMTEAAILYKPDFKCQNISTGKIIYVEAKGYETAMWRLKRRLWLCYGPAPLMVYTKKNKGVSFKETLVPKGCLE